MKIWFFGEEKLLVKVLQIFVLLIGFFGSSAVFAANVQICEKYSSSGSVVYYFDSATSAFSYYMPMFGFGGASSQSAALAACGLYKNGSSFVSSCPAGYTSDSNRNCIIASVTCWNNTTAPTLADCPFNPCGGSYVQPTHGSCSNGHIYCDLGFLRQGPLCISDNSCSGVIANDDYGIPTCFGSGVRCWNDSWAADENSCPPYYLCPDGTKAIDEAHCPISYYCPSDGTWKPTPEECRKTDLQCAYNEKWDDLRKECTAFFCPEGSIYAIDSGTTHRHCEKCFSNFTDDAQTKCINVNSQSFCQTPTELNCIKPVETKKPNGDTVQTYPDGTVVTTHPDGTVTTTPPSGSGNPSNPSPNNNPPPSVPDTTPTEKPDSDSESVPGDDAGDGIPSNTFGINASCEDGGRCIRTFKESNEYLSKSFAAFKNLYSNSEDNDSKGIGDLQPSDNTCPAFHLNFSWQNTNYSYKMDTHCLMMENSENYISVISQACYLIYGLFIIFKA